MGKKKSVTIGYWYGLGLHMGLCVGPIDALRRILGDGKEMWSGNVTANTTLTIDKPNLYGGKKKEGGVQGTLTVMMGAADQAPNAYLQGQLGTPMPAFRGLVTVVYKGLIAAMNPYIKPWSFQVSRWTAGWRTAVWESALCKVGDGANPAHIIYRAITDPVTGLGLDAAAALDLPRMRAAAQTLYDEGLGLNLKWSRSEVIGNFIGMVCDHVGGTMATDPATGLQYLKLYRADYDINTVPLIDETNIIDLASYEQAALAGSVNQVTVTYHDLATNKDVPVTLSNLASIQAQGRIVSQATTYAGIGTADLAKRLAQRDLGNFGALPARLKCTVQAALDVRKGDVVAFSWQRLSLVRMPMRILEIDRGTVGDGKLTLTCAQDTTALPTTTYVVQQPPLWIAPDLAPQPSPAVRLREVPYRDLVATLDDYALSQITTDSGYVSALGVRPSGVTYDYELQTKINAGGTYVEVASGGFTPTGTLAAAMPQAAGPTAITLLGAIDLDQVTIGDAALVDSEICRVTAIDPVAGTCTLARGCADSVPAAHASGARVWFTDADRADDPTEYLTGETIYGRLLTRAGGGLLDAASAPVASVLLARRQALPYAAANVKINGTVYPAAILGSYSLTWAHRDRLTQADQLVDTTAASIGPETGTTYTLRLYGETDTLLRTETGLTGTSYTWSAEEADSGLGSGGDMYFSSVVALLHFDGADGSTTFTDAKGHTFTANGNAQIDTAQSKFGGASGFFDGTGDYLSAAGSTDWDFGTGDFTIELWVRMSVSGRVVIASGSATWESGAVGINADTTGPKIFAAAFGGDLARGPAMLLNTWHHLAVTRSGNTFRVFVDGVSGTPVTFTGSINFGHGGSMKVGSNWDAAFMWSGWMDELRITKGVARYTAAFTPPIAPFMDTAGDARLNGRIRAELEAVRSGLTSYQKHNITTDRAGWGYQWGNYWGGI